MHIDIISSYSYHQLSITRSQRGKDIEKAKMKMRRSGVWIFQLAAALLSFFPELSSSSPDSFIYVGCTQLKYNPGTPYESNVNSVLASLVNSASISNFNHFKVSLPGSTQSDVVYGLFQCRGDLTTSDCHTCVANAVSRLGTYCVGTSGAALQLDGCFVKYDNTSFVGVQDKSVVYDKCGAPVGYESDLGSRRDALLAYLTSGGQYFRVGGSGRVQGMVQCVQDLSAAQCQDCLSEAAKRLKTECATSPWGDVFLGKCYARYSQSGGGGGGGGGYTSPSESERDENDETEKTLALIIGIIAAVTLLVIFLSFLTKSKRGEDGK